jgi:hypothetical protein
MLRSSKFNSLNANSEQSCSLSFKISETSKIKLKAPLRVGAATLIRLFACVSSWKLSSQNGWKVFDPVR